jgi:hypothetical protein
MDRLTRRLAQYEAEVLREIRSPAATDVPSASQYSLRAEERRRDRKRRRRQRKKKSPGRRPNEVKFADAQRTKDVYPPGIPHDECRLVRQRAVWRLITGRAVLPQFTLQHVLDEGTRWMRNGVSLFRQQLQAISRTTPALENTS